MKTTIITILLSLFLLCIAGCGPGQPFELNAHNNSPTQSSQFAMAR